jgi:hypothetical protein
VTVHLARRHEISSAGVVGDRQLLADLPGDPLVPDAGLFVVLPRVAVIAHPGFLPGSPWPT